MAERTIALTFDDGPAERTKELSAYLKEEGIPATFFINGQWVTGDFEFQAGVLDAIQNDGHLLANHATSHVALTTLQAEEIVSEVAATDAILAKYTPPEKLYFRPPFGDWSPAVGKALAASPMKKYLGPVHWDIGDQMTATSAADWDCWDDAGNGKQTVEQCSDLYMKEIRQKKQGIALLHDGPPFSDNPLTVDLVKTIVPILKKEGYKFVRLDDVKLKERQFPQGGGGGGGGGGPQAIDAGPLPDPFDPCRRQSARSLSFEPHEEPAPIASLPFKVDRATYACGGANNRAAHLPHRHKH